MGLATLKEYLSDWTLEGRTRGQVAETVLALAAASAGLSELVGRGALADKLGRVVARAGEIDEQKEIDVLANNIIVEELKALPVAALASEESEFPDCNSEPTHRFWLRPIRSTDRRTSMRTSLSERSFLSCRAIRRPLERRHFFGRVPISSPRASSCMARKRFWLLTVGHGTQIFTLDKETRTYHLTTRNVSMPPEADEYAINASNARHWDDPIRIYIHDCENGANGPRGHDFNMRWTGSPVADIYRILTRGGIYLYPGDRRKGFQPGPHSSRSMKPIR